ncbi:sugar-binding transcriptional regulator [Ferdinandcohnia quinoae]|uniref:Sugar-binding transcriptional regulator n=1 Tax=Fredinandcohnia quinoae TaxID=2918902 RepID=A0AAW5E1R6_9BACI|nr:sugar-binding transcriptional regulator [Fredinandcohnia sp. SECRCQ15]MCH1626850.1 sugar-binding transcriptional regulator [Fredinandcohnia sp. SECRCQ15]
MEKEKIEKIVEAARLYYQLDYSQQDIAQKLGISRPTVSRFLKQAKEKGIVEIKINDPTENGEILAIQLKEKYQLHDVVVVSTPVFESTVIKKYLGETAAEYLAETVKEKDVIATSWGTTIYEVAKSLKPKPIKDVTIVQLNGGVSHSETKTYATEIIHLFGEAFHTHTLVLPLPAIVDHVVVKQAVEADRHIRKVLEKGYNSNIAIFSIGTPVVESVLLQAEYLSKEDIEILQTKAVGEICSRFFDSIGQICHEELNNRTIGIELADLRKKEKSILVAGGPNKVEAIYGALSGSYANILITDQFTGSALLEKD